MSKTIEEQLADARKVVHEDKGVHFFTDGTVHVNGKNVGGFRLERNGTWYFDATDNLYKNTHSRSFFDFYVNIKEQAFGFDNLGREPNE